MPGGELRESLRFEKRKATTGDGHGNFEGDWESQFTTAARVRPLRGSETVIAARLTGEQPVTITIRSFVKARQVTVHWRAVDTRSGAIYNIRSPGANIDERNRYIEFMADSGVPV